MTYLPKVAQPASKMWREKKKTFNLNPKDTQRTHPALPG